MRHERELMKMNDTIGIDISKAHLDVYRLSDGVHAQFSNTKTGFERLQKWVGSDVPTRVVYSESNEK